MRNTKSNLPLTGVKVIDFGQYIAGPAVAMLLGDLGATVVHIDPPDGPMWDSPANAALMRNKMIVTLDLKSEEGLAQARALCAEADIIVENFRPGKLAALGIDFTEMRTARPELITVSIPGFASNDAERREQRAFESVVAANSGVFTEPRPHGFEPVLLSLAAVVGLCLANCSLGHRAGASVAAIVRFGRSYRSAAGRRGDGRTLL